MKLQSFKSLRAIVFPALLIVPVLLVLMFGVYTQAKYHETMTAADLFNTSGSGGKGFCVQVQPDKAKTGKKYTKAYLSGDLLPSDPKDVGYVIRVTYQNTKITSYSISGSSLSGIIPGYRVDTVIELYDRAAGSTIDTVTLTGSSNLPSRISRKTTNMSPVYGSHATAQEITQQVKQLAAQVQ